MNSLVSIVIPVYNVEKYISRSIESVIAQTYKNIEIIIVNDGSTDKSKDIIESYLYDERIKLINQENKGLSDARNTGIQNAKGKYIIFVDGDDIIETKLIENTLKRLLSDGSDIVIYGYKKVKEDLTIITEPNFGNRILKREEAFKELLALSLSPMACNKLYKTEIFKKNNISFPSGKLHEDIGIMYKIFWHCSKISTMSDSYYYWINREESITGTLTFKHINHMIEFINEIKFFLIQNNIYTEYEKAYNIGILKLLNLMLDRSLNSSKGLVEFLLYYIKEEILIPHDNIALIENINRDIFIKFIKLKKEAEVFVRKKEINSKDFYELHKKNRYLKEELDKIQNMSCYKVYKKFRELRDIFFPKGSKRREILKKLKG